MAPTKRKTETKPSENNVQTTTKTTRVTRSSTRQETPKAAPAAVVEPPVPKAAKKAKVTKKEEEPVEEVVVTSSKAENGRKAVPKAGKKGKASSKVKPDPKAEEEEEPAFKAENGNVSSSNKTLVVEHCKQCTQFKIRGVKVKEELEKAVAGITVVINPEKPRRGCFEIREEGGKTFISLLDMKRPFAPMKALNMDAVISDIIEQVK